MGLIVFLLFILVSESKAQCIFAGDQYICIPDNFVQSATVNWDNLSQSIQNSGVNWISLNDDIQNDGINWDDQNLTTGKSVCWNGTKLSGCTDQPDGSGDCTCP
jgi:hypothetical protein